MSEQVADNGRERMGGMEKPEFTLQRITDGFEFGDGVISGCEGDPETLRIIDDAIETDPAILVAIDAEDDGSPLEDDGCGDGRGVGRIFGGGKKFKRSLNRAKVFGGAAAMAAAARIGLGEAEGRPLNKVFDDSIDELNEKHIDFGAHTADHIKAGREALDSGCGAIDGAPEVVRAAVKFEQAIRGVIKSLHIDDEGLDDVFANYRRYDEQLPALQPYSGKQVMDRIVGAGNVVKELVGGHKERRIVINAVRGYTVDQGLIRARTGDKAQVFAFDSWRLEDIAARLQPEDSRAQHKALLSELVYTLGVAAVLTPGDMPVYMIRTS